MICALTIAFEFIATGLRNDMAMLHIASEIKLKAPPGHYVTITNVPPEKAKHIRQVFNREPGIGAFYDESKNEVRIVRLVTEN